MTERELRSACRNALDFMADLEVSANRVTDPDKPEAAGYWMLRAELERVLEER
jgi:hypothetical protein